MSELTLALIAACCAVAMVLLVRAGASPDLRAAIRTTMVLVVGWSFASVTRPAESLHDLSTRAWSLLILSCLALVASWALYLRRARQPVAVGTLSIDQVNIGFAILFAATFFGAQPTSQSAWSAMAIVAGAVLLARR